MTKTLTEQWRNGELQFGFYYVKFPNEEPQIYSSEYLKSFTVVKDAGRIEILAPVPSYDEYIKLKRDLDEYALTYLIGKDVNNLTQEENKKLKKQLADASKTIERLNEQLEIAKKALDCYKADVFGDPYISRLVTNTIKEMEGVK